MTDITPEMLERINEIFRKYFIDHNNISGSTDANPNAITVAEDTKSIPMVAATVTQHLRSFSQGQKVYIYDVYWGMNEKALIIARHQRKHDFIFGVLPIKKLEKFRPEYVYHPKVLEKLRLANKYIDYGIFSRFFNLPHKLDARNYRHFLLTGKVIPPVLHTVPQTEFRPESLIQRLIKLFTPR